MPVFIVTGEVEEFKTWAEAEAALSKSLVKSIGDVPKVIDGKLLTVNIISRTVVDSVKLA
jgi:hypothetical protein